MSNIKFNGDPVELSGTTPQVGDQLDDFTFVKTDLSEGNLSDYEGKKKVLMVLPSLDTGICQKEARAFNESLDGKKRCSWIGHLQGSSNGDETLLFSRGARNDHSGIRL